MKKLLIFVILSLGINLVYAQDTETNKPNLQSIELPDSTVIQTIDWLINTPLEKEPIKRYELQNELLNWLVTTDKVTVNVDFKIVNFIERNPDLLYYFFCGWTNYAYKHNLKVEDLDANEAAVTTVVNFYNKNRHMFERDRNIEQYDKLIKKGKLRKYLENLKEGKKSFYKSSKKSGNNKI